MNKIFLLIVLWGVSISAKAFDYVNVSEGVIVDKQKDIFYIMTADQSLLALQSDGQELWQLPVSAKPLFLQGDFLISMKDSSVPGNLTLLTQRAGDGELINTLNVPMPEEVIARLDDDFDKRFDLEVQLYKGQTHLYWSFEHKKMGGAEQGPEENRMLQDLRGVFKMEFDAQQAKITVTPVKESDSMKPDFDIPEQLKSHWDNRELLTVPVSIGQNYHAVGIENGQAFIKTFNKSDGQVSAKIQLNQPLSHFYKVSAEQENVAVPKRLTNSLFYRYDWSVHSLFDGKSLGSIKSPYSPGDYYVKSNSVYYIEGPWKRRIKGGQFESQGKSLIGFNFSTDKQMWRIAIRDTRYFGATPP